MPSRSAPDAPERGDTWKHPYYRASELEAWTDEDWTLPEEWFDAGDDDAEPARALADDADGESPDDRPRRGGGRRQACSRCADSLGGCRFGNARGARAAHALRVPLSTFSRARIGPDGRLLER